MKTINYKDYDINVLMSTAFSIKDFSLILDESARVGKIHICRKDFPLADFHYSNFNNLINTVTEYRKKRNVIFPLFCNQWKISLESCNFNGPCGYYVVKREIALEYGNKSVCKRVRESLKDDILSELNLFNDCHILYSHNVTKNNEIIYQCPIIAPYKEDIINDAKYYINKISNA